VSGNGFLNANSNFSSKHNFINNASSSKSKLSYLSITIFGSPVNFPIRCCNKFSELKIIQSRVALISDEEFSFYEKCLFYRHHFYRILIRLLLRRRRRRLAKSSIKLSLSLSCSVVPFFTATNTSLAFDCYFWNYNKQQAERTNRKLNTMELLGYSGLFHALCC